MQNSNNLGATPSMDKIFGCFARLQIITSLRYFWSDNRWSALSTVAEGETPYFINLFGRILLVHAKRFDRKHLVVVSLIGELPDIKESSRCERSFVRLAERGGNYV